MMVYFKFDALYWYVSIESLLKVGGVKKLNGSLYWWVEQCVPTYIKSATALADKYKFKFRYTCALLLISS